MKPEIVNMLHNSQNLEATKIIASVWAGTFSNDTGTWSLKLIADGKMKFVYEGLGSNKISCELVIDTETTSLPNAELAVTPLKDNAVSYLTIVLKKIVTESNEMTF